MEQIQQTVMRSAKSAASVDRICIEKVGGKTRLVHPSRRNVPTRQLLTASPLLTNVKQAHLSTKLRKCRLTRIRQKAAVQSVDSCQPMSKVVPLQLLARAISARMMRCPRPACRSVTPQVASDTVFTGHQCHQCCFSSAPRYVSPPLPKSQVIADARAPGSYGASQRHWCERGSGNLLVLLSPLGASCQPLAMSAYGCAAVSRMQEVQLSAHADDLTTSRRDSACEELLK